MRKTKELRLEAGGHTVAAIEFPGDGEPLVCFHGWLDNAESFRPLAEALPHRRLIAVDFPGHGKSYRFPRGARQHYLELVPFVFQTIDALKLRQVSVIGHSMGAGVASLAAGVFPDRFQKIILIEGIGPITTPPQELPEHMAIAIQAASRKILTQQRYYPSKEAAIAARASAGEIGQEAASLLAKRGLSKTRQGYFWNSDPRLKQPSLYRLSEDQVTAFLQRTSAEVLLVKAEQTLPVLAEHFDKRRGHVRKMTYITLPGNHHLHMLQPTAVAKAIDLFLS